MEYVMIGIACFLFTFAYSSLKRRVSRLESKVVELVKSMVLNHPQILDGMEIEFCNGDKIKCVDGVWVDGKEE